MVSNLSNVYAYLRKTYEDVNISFSKPLSYIKTLTNELDSKQKFIIIYNEDNFKVKTELDEDIASSTMKLERSLNLTGSPLKDDASIHELINSSIAYNLKSTSKPWNDSEVVFTPIDIGLARKIVMEVNNEYQNNDNGKGWIFILSQMKDSNRIPRDFLMSTCLTMDKEHIRGVGSYLGIVNHNEKSAEELEQRHKCIISKSLKFETKMESSFAIATNITLKFTNNASNLSINHLDNFSEVNLYQKIEIGNCHPISESFWDQIQLLNLIKTDIMNYKSGTLDGSLGVEPTFSHGLSDQTYSKMQMKVDKILTEVGSFHEPDFNAQTMNFEDAITAAKNRFHMDITDDLWDLLRFSASYSDLKKTFAFIFQSACRSGVVNIPTNKNHLASLIREICQQRIAIPHLIGSEPLELLFEIGVEKITKDFEYIFTQTRIGSLSDLTSHIKGQPQHASNNRLSVRKTLAGSVEPQSDKMPRKTLLKNAFDNDETDDDENDFRNSRFKPREGEKSVALLARTYLVIEHLISIQINLPMHHNYMDIAKLLFDKPLKSLDELREMKFDEFEHLMSNGKKVINVVRNIIPNEQKFVIKSSNNFQRVESVFYYNIEHIVPFLVDENIKKAETSRNSFHFYSYVTIASVTCHQSR